MISYQEALSILLGEARIHSRHISVEKKSLLDGVGRVIASAIGASENNPRFDNSAMDGFLVQSSRLKSASPNNPIRLEVAGVISAGDDLENLDSNGDNAIEIMTGAPIPKGVCDTVVRLEDVEEMQENGRKYILITQPVNVGENIRSAGEDFKVGDVLAQKGSRLGSEHVLTLSTSGICSVEVYRKPKVNFFSTGDEIVAFDGEQPSTYQIRNSTAPFLCSALGQYGVEAHFLGIARDSREAIRAKLIEAIEGAPDVIISTGGVSAGKFDLIKEVLLEVGAKVYFHKVLVRPGKPILFCGIPGSKTVFFGLPGNPVSVAAGLRFFVRPYLRELMGEQKELSHKLPLTVGLKKPEGLTFFQRGNRQDLGVCILRSQGSAMVSSLCQAQGWIVAEPGKGVLEKGEPVEWYSLW